MLPMLLWAAAAEDARTEKVLTRLALRKLGEDKVNTPAMIPSAPKPTAASPGAATDAGAATRTSPAPAAPHAAVVPGLAATHFAPWTVACGRVSVANFLDFSAAIARTPGIFAFAKVLWIEDTREVRLMAPTSQVRRVRI